LNALLLGHIQTLKPKLWKGYRLLAFDGSTAALPASKEIKKKFGISSSTQAGTKNCLAQCLFCVDVLSGYMLGYRIGNMSEGEGSMFKKMIRKIKVARPSIILLDRGFGNYCNLHIIFSQNRNCCVRMSSKISGFARMVMKDGRSDFIADWHPSETERVTARSHNLKIIPLKVRVSKVVLATGEIELLVGNLYNDLEISNPEMKSLYFKRWGIEESIKKMKPKMKLEFWGCRKTKSIYQEFYANVFMYNLVCILGTEAQTGIEAKTKKRKLEYKYNWQNAYRFTRERILPLLDKELTAGCLCGLIKEIARSMIAISPERNYPRNKVQKDKSRSYQCYK
jgi:Transposase DDE domain